ncbi:hypothetical protein H4S02_001369 [Coemansia sp. RSA 2611]|nr:hypothetical protein H4S02_001369 [Coemansia sp. RSA 2611]
MSGGSYSDTPERASGSADVPATGVVEDKVLEERRNAITKSLANAGHNLGFDKLLHLLKLNADYATFGTSMRQKIADLVEQAPAVVGGKIYSTRPARHSSEGDPTYEFGSPQPLTEKALVSCFAPLLEKMICSSDDGSQIMPQRYTVNDHHEFADMGTIIKPGGVVCYRHHGLPGFKSAHIALEAKVSQCDGQAPAKHLGQMGDYALHIWDAQPTRTFVPVLYLHGPFISLFIFTRSGYHQVELGAMFYKSCAKTRTEADKLYLPYIKFAFLLDLPPQRFRHFVDVSTSVNSLNFSDGPLTKTIAGASAEKDGYVDISDHIERRVHIHRRLAYLFRMQFESKRAVLKISWTPINRLPECAIYDHIGYTKFLPNAPTKNLEELAAKWLFDFESVIENKDKHDLITGAPLFMSTRVLLSSKRRGIFDDLKSLLYVVLYALWKVEPALVGTPDGFLHFSDQSMVLAQIACFMDNSIYLKMFGVRDCHVNLSELLDKLYQLVCYEGSTFIPGEQLEDSKFERTPDRSLLKEIGSGGSPDLKRKAMIRVCADLEFYTSPSVIFEEGKEKKR